ncbi:hypothetical protein AVW11_13915 [Streptomyces amritsarensis]|uniref:Uncharacterized protein n=1 Tax=Streptomyces amritsarensis TaxID=681158 RepID=A0ABX3G3M7_9ACTN|nr:hypothetical protein [Streptomyces amritsarensis]OLZ67310.1 hypothetical protein AVW11_13915 [Streptomyces amritsarensis]
MPVGIAVLVFDGIVRWLGTALIMAGQPRPTSGRRAKKSPSQAGSVHTGAVELVRLREEI